LQIGDPGAALLDRYLKILNALAGAINLKIDKSWIDFNKRVISDSLADIVVYFFDSACDMGQA
jgi:hypothetical protein